MTTSFPQTLSHEKLQQLGLPEEIVLTAVNFIYQNRNLVNALDNATEMDDYIYRAAIKQVIEKRKAEAYVALNDFDELTRAKAEKDLCVLSREELVSDPFYRAVLPLLVKVVAPEPILRLYAEAASAMILSLADCKRRHRATSITEIIVRHYVAEMESQKF
jgi:hypothetical protein